MPRPLSILLSLLQLPPQMQTNLPLRHHCPLLPLELCLPLLQPIRHSGGGARAAVAAATIGGEDRGGKGEALQHLFGAAQERWHRAQAAKGHLSAVGSTVRSLLSEPVADYGKTTSAHDTVASKYPTETVVQAACTPNFSIPKPSPGPGRAAVGARALLTFVRSIRNNVLKIATFVHYVPEEFPEEGAIFG